MGIDNTDRRFFVKISSLFLVLALGVMVNKTQPVLKDTNQDIINIKETKKIKKPTRVQTITATKNLDVSPYNNPLP